MIAPKLRSLVAVGALLALPQGKQKSPQRVPDDHEPDAELRLEYAGKSVAVRVGEKFKIDVGGRSVEAVLHEEGFRRFDHGGIRFRYPTRYGFSFAQTDEGYDFWVLNSGRV